jgi:four helix bundle protein
VVGSAGSVGANYREANDALGKKDFLQHMKIARREAKESHHWLDCILEANETEESEILPLLKEADELKKILSSIIGKFQQKQDAKRNDHLETNNQFSNNQFGNW